VEIFRGDKGLANDARTNGFSVAIADLAVGFVFEEQLRQRGDQQRINHAQQIVVAMVIRNAVIRCFLMKSSGQVSCRNQHVDDLDAHEGAISPPTP